MPFLDGYDATRQIRNLESATSKRVAIVALTANALTGDRQNALDAGMDDYLAKPFRQEQLIDMIHTWTLAENEEVQTASSQNDQLELPRDMPDAPLDLPVLRGYTKIKNGEGKDLLDIIIDGFLKNGDIYFSELDKAIDENDCPGVVAVAHKFKSASGQAGGTQLMQMLIELEKMAKESSSTAGLLTTVSVIRKEFTLVTEALPNVREKL